MDVDRRRGEGEREREWKEKKEIEEDEKEEKGAFPQMGQFLGTRRTSFTERNGQVAGGV